MKAAQEISDMREDFAALDLNPGATLDEVKTAYRRLARALHPDLHPGAAGMLMARINRAYDNLSRRLSTGQRSAGRTSARPASGQGWSTYRFEDFGAQAAESGSTTCGGSRSERPSPGEFSRHPAADPASGPGFGPLGGGQREPAWSDAADERPGQAPLWEDRAGDWRLLGVRLEGKNVIYQVEISGRARSLVLPVRRQRACHQCSGTGHQLTRDGLAPCPACGGKGSLVRPEQVQVDLPTSWLPGRRVPVQACSDQGSILVELRRGRAQGRN